ncbi:hypothetical protein [Streptomyces sp. NPDC127197]|uniref:hypothetical protein n=1 Tax=Streptomyces sp. NPDC127197 TaxID=3345388 RepID=UPI00364162A9
MKRALARATSDVSTDGIGIGGFNASAVGDLAKAGKPDPKATTKTDGWVSEGESEASGPGVGTSVTGPDTGAGKLGEAKAHADLGRASAEGSLTNGPMKLAGEAEAYAGAGLDGVQLGGEAFAGARAGVSGGVDIGGIGVGATAERWAGPGVEATLNFSKDANGTWHWAPKVGVSPILGGAVGFEVTVDPGKIADTAGSAADAVGDAAEWVADGVGSLF